MAVKKTTSAGTSTSAERTGKNLSWGDNGRIRPTTKEYSDGWDRIFGKKDNKVVDDS